MTRDEALLFINEHPEMWLPRDKSHKGYICPICGNGSGTDGDGLRLNPKVKTPHYKCFKCGFYGDIVDLIATFSGIALGTAEAFEMARKVYNITVEGPIRKTSPAGGVAPSSQKPKQKKEEHAMIEQEIIDYIQKAIDNAAPAVQYLEKRGISKEVTKKYCIGYDAEKDALVIPVSSGCVLRFLNPLGDRRYSVYRSGKMGVFNVRDLKRVQGPLFVVEGAIDALSIIQCGFPAVGVQSATGVNAFLECIENLPACPHLILSMDNDEAGKKATEALEKGLSKLHIPYTVASLYGDKNDANEALQADSKAFSARLKSTVEAYQNSVKEINENKVSNSLAHYFDNLQERSAPVPTGFSKLDASIGGGLFQKFYCIGALPTTGKTTFVMQIADYIAEHGTDVLVFALEMRRDDLIAKSVSRITYTLSEKQTAFSCTELDITSYVRWASFSKKKLEVRDSAFDAYKKRIAGNLFIYEGRRTADDIVEKVSTYKRITGRIPVVVVDYLQLIKPSAELMTATTKEQVNDAVDKLSSLRNGTAGSPVIVISSFNRQSYTGVPDMDSFKESGEIEYTADALFALAVPGKKRSPDKDKTEAAEKTDERKDRQKKMSGDSRDMNLVILKNRGNPISVTISYLYTNKFNHFKELEKEKNREQKQEEKQSMIDELLKDVSVS